MNSAEETATQWLHDTVRVYLRARREGKLQSISKEWVGLCWDIGHSLAMMQAHGILLQPVIETVSAKLRLEFLGYKGLYPVDFQLMRLFYLNYFEREKILPKLRDVAWESHKIILDQCKDPLQQEFYLGLILKENFTTEALIEALKLRRFETSALPALV